MMAVIIALLPPVSNKSINSINYPSNHATIYLLPLFPNIKLTHELRFTSSLAWHIKSVSNIFSITPSSTDYRRDSSKHVLHFTPTLLAISSSVALWMSCDGAGDSCTWLLSILSIASSLWGSSSSSCTSILALFGTGSAIFNFNSIIIF